MHSETSKTKYPTAPITKTVITGPTIPQDIVNEIADHLVIDLDFRSIRACALLSKSSVQPCRRHLFRTLTFTPRGVDKWFKTFPVPEESPAHHVKDLCIWIAGAGCVPEKFFKYTQWFTNAESISLLGYRGVPLMRRTSLWRFPKSVTSLAIDTNVVTLLQVRDVMTHLPNLDDLSLSGSLVTMDRREPLGIGTVLRGRFGGKLILSDEYASEDVFNMLLKIPSGLRFTEVQVHCTRERLCSAVRLIEACGNTLVRLSHTIPVYYGPDILEQSLDFSKLPNLREVNLVLRLAGGGPPRIPVAFSTLRPATSPHLSTIRLEFACEPTLAHLTETVVDEMINYLEQLPGETTRIQREFEGAVDFTVAIDSKFEAVLGKIDIPQLHRR